MPQRAKHFAETATPLLPNLYFRRHLSLIPCRPPTAKLAAQAGEAHLVEASLLLGARLVRTSAASAQGIFAGLIFALRTHCGRDVRAPSFRAAGFRVVEHLCRETELMLKSAFPTKPT